MYSFKPIEIRLRRYIEFQRKGGASNIYQIDMKFGKGQFQYKKLLKQKQILLKGIKSFSLSDFLTNSQKQK